MPLEPTKIPSPLVLISYPLAAVPIPTPPLPSIATNDVPEPTWNVLVPGEVVPTPTPSKI